MRGLLLIADGMGLAPAAHGNAVVKETMPFLFGRIERHGAAILEASGEAVGLSSDQPGNSEIGHLTIGSGRRLPATLSAIRATAEDGSWGAHPLWNELAKHGRIHVVGLASDAGVHGHHWTLTAAAELARRRGAKEVHIHAILDGVDSRLGSAPELLGKLGPIASVIGRKWACDRSGKMELARACVAALAALAEAPLFEEQTLQQHLARGEGEATFPCHRFANAAAIAPGDCVLLTNHRADRTVQLARAFAEDHPTYALVELGDAVLKDRVFFPTHALDRGLMFELAALGVPTVRIAEECKFPHVTRFVNGFSAELTHRSVCVPSIPEAMIRERPEMSLAAVLEAILTNMSEDQVIVANLANLDQVGHLGSIELAVHAARLIDDALKQLHTAAADRGFPILFTSDHGNADVMIDGAGRPIGSHSMNPVPMIALGAAARAIEPARGSLANVAPTFLELLGARAPAWMDPSFHP